MDQWWQSAPVPAVRIWPHEQGVRWSANAAANDWAAAHGLDTQGWRQLATEALDLATLAPGDLSMILGHPGTPMRCRVVALPDGALAWLWASNEPPTEAPVVAIAASALQDLALPAAGTGAQTREASAFLGRALVLADVSVWRIDLATRRVHYNLLGYRQMGIAPTPEGVDLDAVRGTIHPLSLIHI